MESTFQVAICECPEVQGSTMAVDVTGRYALISGRKSMMLVDLDGGAASTPGVPSTSSAILSESGSSEPSGVSSPVNDSGQDSAVTSIKRAPISKRFVRNSKYEPTASHFSRHMTDLFALTAYQVVEVFSIEDLNPQKPKLVLRGHSRAIADVEWSHFDPYLLGTSAADCLTNLWDIRDSRRPSVTLTSVCGSTLVRFSKTSSNLIATSHEIDVRIWDIRQQNLPLYYIGAHLQKINGMDWNPSKTSCDHEQLITSSQDSTIKLWDLNGNKIKPSATFPTRTPAWRVRYTPVSSNAILTSTLPQLRARNECMALKLWSMKPNRYEQKKLELMLGLVGHTDVIVDFDWRARPSSDGCEIVSWSKDQTLRVWKIDQQFIEMNVDNSDFETDEVPDATSDSIGPNSFLTENMTSAYQSATASVTSPDSIARPREGNSPSTAGSTAIPGSAKSRDQNTDTAQETGKETDEESDLDEVSTSNMTSTNELKQEFNLINKNIPNIEFDELNWLRRVCLVTARAQSITCRLRIALPPSYPNNECPTFTIIDSHHYGCEALSKEAKEKLLHSLNETAKSQLSRSRNCIEPCLRKFITALQKIMSMSSYKRRTPGAGPDYKDDPISLSAQRDHSIPFPPTSGARFCGNLLVCFGRPMIPTVNTSTLSSGESANWLVETPRSMAQLSAQLDNMRRQGSYNLNHISISYFYYGAMRRAELQRERSSKNNSSSASRAGSKYMPGGRGKSALHTQSIMSKSYKCGPVIVFDVFNLLGGICRELAENYVFDRDVIKMCRRNAEIAASYNRRDLVQIWSLAELSSEGVIHSYMPHKMDSNHPLSLINHDSDFGDRPWTMHPFGSKLIQSLIDHYVNNCHDVQTAAMLVWTFSSPKLGRSICNQSVMKTCSNSKAYNPLHSDCYSGAPGAMPPSAGETAVQTSVTTAINVDNISGDWNFVNGPETHLYSSSWSNSALHEHLADGCVSHSEQCNKLSGKLGGVNAMVASATTGPGSLANDVADDVFPKLNILNPERALQNDLIMHIYAELLYRLNLLNQRAMVLKNIGSHSAYSKIFGNKQTSNELVDKRLPNLTIQCYNSDCRNKCQSAQCPNCKKFSLYCSICRLPVRGSSSVCLKCFHGGHVNHFDTWFNSNDFCPTGCGCKCLSAEC